MWHASHGLLVTESDGRQMHRVRAFDVNAGTSTAVYGKDSKCNCDRHNCPCDDRGRDTLAAVAQLHNPTALAVDNKGGGM